MRKVIIYLFTAAGIIFLVALMIQTQPKKVSAPTTPSVPTQKAETPSPEPTFPLAISVMRKKSYPGSEITIEQTLAPGANYHRYVVSYRSEGLKIYGLLTVPTSLKPQGGWPVIVINHGYIPPQQYSTISSYASIVDALAPKGFMVFKPDYRGHGDSEGQPTQVYVSPDYVTDSMNAIASIKQYNDANPKKIGIWAHSMGGNITLHELVLPAEVQAVDIWSGVVGNYADILSWWDARVATGVLTTQNDLQTAQRVTQFQQMHGTPQSNPDFWKQIDPTNFLSAVTVPVFIQVGTGDQVVPPNFSESLYSSLKKLGKNVQLTTYPGADHNLVPDSANALAASFLFFDTLLK